MILASIIMGAVLGAGIGGIVVAFWDEIVDFLKRAIEKVKNMITGFVYGTKIFLKKTKDGFIKIARIFSEINDNTKVGVTTIEEPIDINELPKDIQDLVLARQGAEVDITEQMTLQLENAH